MNSQSIKSFSDKNSDSFNDLRPFQSLNLASDYQFTQKDTGDVISSIPAPGPNSEGLTWDGASLWCSDIINDYIYKIDPLDGTVTYSFASPDNMIEGLAWDGTNLWCSDNEADAIYKLNPENGSVVLSFQYTDVWFHGITWDGQYLWANDFQNKVISKINAETGEIISSINSPENKCIGLTWDGFHLWTDDFTTHKLYCLSPDNGSVIYEVTSPTSNPRDLAWDGEYLWVISYEAATIYQVDVGGVTSVNDQFIDKTHTVLFFIYPNPVIEDMNIKFIVEKTSDVLIKIIDQTGSTIKIISNKKYYPGEYLINWNGKSASNKMLSKGLYSCVFRCGTQTTTKKIIIK